MSILNKAARGLPLLLSLISANGWATTLAEALSAAESYSAELSANDHQVNALKNRADSAMQLPQDYVSSTKRERKADSITAEARQAAANADVIRARLQRETAQAWLALAVAQKSLRSVQALISETSRQINVQKAGVSSASASPGSVLDVQLALNAMKNEQDNARRDVQIARARLLQLTGKEVRDISGPLPRIERLPADEAALMAGIKLHPEVIQAAREADLAKAKSG
ncbi:MAG: TolC family protein, partial [Klebsiella michiganensis]|nr:TolC family protein [Klebsiella michiganensis]